MEFCLAGDFGVVVGITGDGDANGGVGEDEAIVPLHFESTSNFLFLSGEFPPKSKDENDDNS